MTAAASDENGSKTSVTRILLWMLAGFLIIVIGIVGSLYFTARVVFSSENGSQVITEVASPDGAHVARFWRKAGSDNAQYVVLTISNSDRVIDVKQDAGHLFGRIPESDKVAKLGFSGKEVLTWRGFRTLEVSAGDLSLYVNELKTPKPLKPLLFRGVTVKFVERGMTNWKASK